MFYFLTSINTTLIKVARIISKSNSNDSHYTSWISIIGVLLSATISVIITLFIHSKEESKNNDRVHNTLINASNNTEEQIRNSNKNLNKKLKQNREDIYNNALRVYIYKKMDKMIDGIIDVFDDALELNSESKALLDLKLKEDTFKTFAVPIINRNKHMIKLKLHFINNSIFKFINMVYSLGSLGDMPKRSQIYEIESQLSKLGTYMINDNNNLPNISDEKTQVNRICTQTGKIAKICKYLIPKISDINEYHALRSRNADIESHLTKRMSDKRFHINANDLF